MKRVIRIFQLLVCAGVMGLLSAPAMQARAGFTQSIPCEEKIQDPPAEIEVLSFNGLATPDNKSIDLFCKIKGNCCYNIIIERSSNGKRYTPIATISDDKHIGEFALADGKPNRFTNYYRLKMVDNRGNSRYSKTMVVQLYKSDDLSMVSVTPNTALQDIHVNVQLKNRSYIVMKVTDENGKEILKKKGVGLEGLNTYELEKTGQMTPGNYLLEVLVNSKDLLSIPLIKKG